LSINNPSSPGLFGRVAEGFPPGIEPGLDLPFRASNWLEAVGSNFLGAAEFSNAFAEAELGRLTGLLA
jgi:hypothetical protein